MQSVTRIIQGGKISLVGSNPFEGLNANSNIHPDLQAMFLAEEISGQLLEEAIESAELLEFARTI